MPSQTRNTLIHDHIFGSAEVAKLSGLSLRQLQWWDERGILRAPQQGHRREYGLLQTVQACLNSGLLRKGMKLAQIRKLKANAVALFIENYEFDAREAAPDQYAVVSNGHIVVVAGEQVGEMAAGMKMVAVFPISGIMRRVRLHFHTERPIRRVVFTTDRLPPVWQRPSAPGLHERL